MVGSACAPTTNEWFIHQLMVGKNAACASPVGEGQGMIETARVFRTCWSIVAITTGVVHGGTYEPSEVKTVFNRENHQFHREKSGKTCLSNLK